MMKPMTPFQEALLTATEAQFADVPEEGEIEIHPSQAFYDHIPGKRRALKPFRKAILIAASLALFVGVAVASQFFPLGRAEVEKHVFPVEAQVDAADVYDIVFYDRIADSDAPETIETFYLPTKDVGADTPGIIKVSDHEGLIYSFVSVYDEPDDNEYEDDRYLDHLPENAAHLSADWSVHGRQIMFIQEPAKDVPVGEKYWGLAFPPERHAEIRTEILEINTYEVLSIRSETDIPFQEGRETGYFWFWTDGEYIFQLYASNADEAYMQQLMESVQPIEDITTCFGEE